MAVYTDVEDSELEDFLSEYDLGALLSCKGIAEGVENSNFLLHTEAGTFILTLYEKRVAEADLPFFLGLMEHLHNAGISCPLPVAARDGAALRRLAGRPAVIVSYLEGIWVRRPKVGHCAEVGKALAAMHQAAEGFTITRRNALSCPSWRPLFERSRDYADTVETGLSAFISDELDLLEDRWPDHLPAGVIHADLFPDNVFFVKDRLSGLIDFYFACNDQLSYDLAVCLNAWCFEADNSFNITKARALIQAYEVLRPLTPDEREALPVLARGAALRFLLTRLYDWLTVPDGALVTPKDPMEYVRRLRFHQKVSGVEGYGVGL